MPAKRPYVVVEIGPGYVGGPSKVLTNHVNNLKRRRVTYVALDPFLQSHANAQMLRTVSKAAGRRVTVSVVRYSVRNPLPLRRAVDELHAHCLLVEGKHTYYLPKGGITARRFLKLASSVLKLKGRLFVSGGPLHPLHGLTQQSDEWFNKRGFVVERRVKGRAARWFSDFGAEALIILRRK